jgi:hypothetical protein
MMWLIKPKNIKIISTMQIIIWGNIPKESITGWEIKNNMYIHSPKAADPGLGCSQLSNTLSRSILVESY